MVVNHERAWIRLKAVVLSRTSHGQRDLLKTMADLEVECEIPESEEGFDARPLPPARQSASEESAR